MHFICKRAQQASLADTLGREGITVVESAAVVQGGLALPCSSRLCLWWKIKPTAPRIQALLPPVVCCLSAMEFDSGLGMT